MARRRGPTSAICGPLTLLSAAALAEAVDPRITALVMNARRVIGLLCLALALVVVGLSALFVTGVVREYGMFRNVQDVVVFVGVPVAITGGLVWSWWRLWRPRGRQPVHRR
jgi:hypothetical protein